ncbi:MAG: hypothetical protein RIR26_2012 [Pseudomonadota bacterium]|jgi:hypothetical protein
MNRIKSIQLVLLAVAAASATSQQATAAVWWYEQAERLQLVSAALLDGPPLGEPVPVSGFVEGRVLTSLLPKPNPTVGAKTEKVPAAPVHAVPTLVAGMPFKTSGRYSLVATGWGGYLPLQRGMAKLIGINASLNQYIYGLSAENIFRLNKLNLITSLGAQSGSAVLKGAITAPEANDSFSARMNLFYISQGIQMRNLPLWGNGMILFRRGKSAFNIEAEQTEFIRDDTMADAQVPLALQFTVGVSLMKRSLHLALSEYMVPSRLVMPRASLVYQYAIGKKANDEAEQRSESGVNAPESGQKSKPKLKQSRKRKFTP